MSHRSLAFTGAWLLLGGCSVSLPVTDATARRATNAEAQQIRSTGESFEGTGTLTIVTATVSRHTLGRIAGWQLYTHIRTSDCGTGAISGAIPVPTVDGVPADDFHALDDLLSSRSQQSEFQLEGWVVARPSSDWRRQCLQLDGGGYTFQKIANEAVRVRWID